MARYRSVASLTAYTSSRHAEEAILSSNVADEPDRDAVDRFLVDAYRRAWAGEIASAP
jgi:hypothetical protein